MLNNNNNYNYNYNYYNDVFWMKRFIAVLSRLVRLLQIVVVDRQRYLFVFFLVCFALLLIALLFLQLDRCKQHILFCSAAFATLPLSWSISRCTDTSIKQNIKKMAYQCKWNSCPEGRQRKRRYKYIHKLLFLVL